MKYDIIKLSKRLNHKLAVIIHRIAIFVKGFQGLAFFTMLKRKPRLQAMGVQ